MVGDSIDKGPKRTGVETLGAKLPLGQDLSVQAERLEVRAVDPSTLDPAHAKKDAERLKILTRSAHYQQAERHWLERLMLKLQMPGASAAKALGFGPRKKKYADDSALIAALQATIAPVFAKVWAWQIPPFNTFGSNETPRYYFELAEITDAPPLHPAYVTDLDAYAFSVTQDDIKHVCHSYLMALAHAYLRAIVARKRHEGIDVVAQAVGLLPEHLYVFECNFVQHYVPSSTPAYFEQQPIRAFSREIANAFRKLAFGGQ